jgi:hypothetical protein
MRISIPRPLALAAPLLLLIGGCGPSGGAPALETVPVKGKVTYKGQPLARGVVTFEPRGSGRAATGEIEPDGAFELTTLKKGDGAAPGKHRVSVSGTGPSAKAELVPRKYTEVNTSKLEVEVTRDKTDYPIDLN